MNEKPDVTCIGEIIVDFVSTEKGASLTDAPAFRKFPGGAPANLAVGLVRLGVPTAFIGRVGDDSFGRYLCNELRRVGITSAGIVFDKLHKTRLAFVSLTPSGERFFEFWESHPADIQLKFSDIDLQTLRESRIIHISSFLLLKEPARSALVQLISEFQEGQSFISFDPNIRLNLWDSESKAKQLMLKVVKFTHILRLNHQEATFLTGDENVERSAEKLLQYGPRIVIVTQGGDGCYYRTEKARGYVEGFRVDVVDTTGCGDGFHAGFLRGLLKHDMAIEELGDKDLQSICRYANAVGALVATKSGAITALPDSDRVDEFLEKNS
jgi:fructokinase